MQETCFLVHDGSKTLDASTQKGEGLFLEAKAGSDCDSETQESQS